MRLYAEVTARIVAELEAGAAPWLKPWRTPHTAGVMPVNAVTGVYVLGSPLVRRESF